jgi:hypothetical protein
MYGFPEGMDTVSTPLGNLVGQSSCLTPGRTIQRSPPFQLAGVATLFSAVRCRESMTLRISLLCHKTVVM